MTRRVAAVSLVLVLAATWLTACTTAGATVSPSASNASTDASPSTLPAGVTVELRQLRSDVAARWAQVMFTNKGDEELAVGALRVDDPRLDGPAERITDRTSVVRAGSTVAIPVQLPPVSCSAPDDAEGTVTFAWSSASAAATAIAPLPDPLSLLPPLHERECRAQALAAAADVTISGFTPSPPGEPAGLTLRIAPTGGGAAEITGIHSTNLLTWVGHPGVAYPLGIAVASADTAPTEVQLPMIPLRCDPHAVQEDKRGTVFTLDVDLDGEPGQIQLAASEELRGHILTWVGQWCEFPT